MKKSILALKGAGELSKELQKSIQGGSTRCWTQACGVTREQCIDEFLGFFNKSTNCCGYSVC